jgi:drug/metabolite transporter (DMT)-like permease
MENRLREHAGPFLVGFAAILWATDALFRLPAVKSLSATSIVLLEHAVVVVALLPFMLLKRRRELFAFSRRQWLSLALIGAGASGIATVWFTASFRYTNPSVAILLQKLQPILVILMAYRFLGERPTPKFFAWSSLALVSAVLLSFPEIGFGQSLSGMELKSIGALYALGAASIWATATVAGRAVLMSADFLVLTFWRFFFGLVALSLIFVAEGEPMNWPSLLEPQMVWPLLYMSFVPGLAAMLAYYAGLKRTPASVATIAELLFPVSAVVLNALVLDLSLEPLQIFAGALLLIAVTMISL